MCFGPKDATREHRVIWFPFHPALSLLLFIHLFLPDRPGRLDCTKLHKWIDFLRQKLAMVIMGATQAESRLRVSWSAQSFSDKQPADHNKMRTKLTSGHMNGLFLWKHQEWVRNFLSLNYSIHSCAHLCLDRPTPYVHLSRCEII